MRRTIQTIADAVTEVFLPTCVWSSEWKGGTAAGRGASNLPRPLRLQIEVLEQRFALSGSPLVDIVHHDVLPDVNQPPLADSEFRVNDTAQGIQRTWADANAVAGNSAGLIVVTFSGPSSGDAWDVFAQRYDSTGSPLGANIRVNQTTQGVQWKSSVAIAANGDFVIAWSGQGPGQALGIFVRLFRFDGTAATDEMKANTSELDHQDSPVVAIGLDGGFVVVWSGLGGQKHGGIFARRFAADGSSATHEIQVVSATNGIQQDPAVAIGTDGQFVIAWSGVGEDGSQGIFLQRFRVDGSPNGQIIQVSQVNEGRDIRPTVAILPNGDILVAWEAQGRLGGIQLQRLLSDGSPDGQELRISDAKAVAPSLAAFSDGSFVISWSELSKKGHGWDVVAQRYSAAGEPTGAAFVVNTTTHGPQRFSSIAAGPDGEIFIVWSGFGVDDHHGVFARRFNVEDATNTHNANPTGTTGQPELSKEEQKRLPVEVLWAKHDLGDLFVASPADPGHHSGQHRASPSRGGSRDGERETGKGSRQRGRS